jgi:hypothetical protein
MKIAVPIEIPTIAYSQRRMMVEERRSADHPELRYDVPVFVDGIRKAVAALVERH